MLSVQIYQEQSEDLLSEMTRELNLVYYASDAANKMQFENAEELHEAVKRAMEICLHAGLSVRKNFKQIYKCSYEGVTYDWKLSVLGFYLVCLNGSTANPNTAHMQIDLLKNAALDL